MSVKGNFIFLKKKKKKKEKKKVPRRDESWMTVG
jgi:hypothetical protein